MTQEEWDLTLGGLRVLTKAMRAYIRAEDAAWCAEVDKLPKQLRDKIRAEAHAEFIAGLRKPGRDLPLWMWLWTEVGPDTLVNLSEREAMKKSKELLEEFADKARR